MKKHLLILWVVAGILSGCQDMGNELLNQEPASRQAQQDSVWTVCIEAEKDGLETKGLAVDGTEADDMVLQAVWKTDEPVYVFLGTQCIGTLRATPQEDTHKATLSGTVITSGITPGNTRLTLRTPRETWNYTGQAGRLLLQDDPNNQGDKNRSIENRYHYTMAERILVTDASVNKQGKGTLTTEKASFANQQSIYRMNFRYQKDGTGDKYALDAKRVWIKAAGGGLVQSVEPDGTPVTGTIDIILDEATRNPFFVALRNNNTTRAEDLRFTVMDDEGITYYGTKTIPAQYKPNGTFVSMKNATLTGRLELARSTETVAEVL